MNSLDDSVVKKVTCNRFIDFFAPLRQNMRYMRRFIKMFSSQCFGITPLLLRNLLHSFFLLAFTFFPASLSAQMSKATSPAGIAWRVQGSWKISGHAAPIFSGDAIPPGSLLQPDEKAAPHSITVLLPDGRRFLYECFTTEDCARGFRVPALYRAPEPFAIDMLARIRTVLIHKNQSPAAPQPESSLPREQALAVLNADRKIQVAGLAAHLPNGRYTYIVRSPNPAQPLLSRQAFEKSGPTITLALPSRGLYNLTIIDDLNAPRIDLFVAAIAPAQAQNFEKSFHHAQALMKDWNSNYFGWPIDDFERAYLESLMLYPKQPGRGPEIADNSAQPETPFHRTNITAEPRFHPAPGLLLRETAVALHCDTPGATMHFTVDGSQPHAGSPVYHAPIMVSGTELTIKSFASAPGKKDSPVVTGIFRIQE